ncbi:PREDICTED: uncharacterized protein LOC104738674 [Camelina sativa]|uniref:Uncharacterized protein LOC104738674 n=1 Tax=Camelina sativa TaxID=90675 RepID=A0ABM0VJH1_CAMSA|nr:PREDICTED: uncharacterized protein LOC104738674 [Camelina sativa]XP_010457171.1 PREDICTED: uncharacterized protein LOC104738674 [Camelina sativa]
MNLPRVQMEKQEDSLWSLCPVQDIDTVFANRLLYCDFYFRHYKETLKHTMLGQESIFENQIHELHRLYQRQKDLMMKMEENNNCYTQPQHLFPNAGGRSIHWMGSIISTSKTSVWPPEDASAKIDEAGISGEEIDIWEEEGSKSVEVPSFPKDDQSPRNMPLDSVVQPESVQHLTGLSRFKCRLDLNEPAKIGEHSDYELNQLLTPDQTRSERAEPEVQEPLISTKCQAENGIDLNMSPRSSEEEATKIRTIKSEQPQECVSASLHESEPSHSRAIVLALPSSKTISLFHQRDSRPRPRKKAKRGAKSKSVEKFPRSKSRKRSNLDSNFGINEDDNHSMEKGSSRSLPEVKRRSCRKPHVESDKVMRRISRTKSKTRGSFLVTEEEEQELSVAAAEALVDISSSDLAKMSSIKTSSNCITPLHWFAKIASSVVEDTKSEVGLSVTGVHADCQIDYFETMTLQLTEMKPEEQRTKISVSNIVHPKHKRTLRSRGKRQQYYDFLQSLSTFTGNKASETNDAHSSLMENMVIDWGTIRKRRRGIRSPAAFTRTSIPFLLSGS